MDLMRHLNGRVHFIGIGGISMSGLALILKQEGFNISGSDMRASKTLDKLTAQGIRVSVGHNAENAEGATLVVYTSVIAVDNPELQYAAEHGIDTMDRGTLLGTIMATYPVAIGIAGTHGKSTTTSMISTIFELGGYDPTIHIGAELELIGGSVKPGKGEIFITEACEQVESFLKLSPTCAIILNIDIDHLDYYRDYDHIVYAFDRYTRVIRDGGLLIGNGDDTGVMGVMQRAQVRTASFGFDPKNDYSAADIRFDELGRASFELTVKGKTIGRIQLGVSGRHNILNALASAAASLENGANIEQVITGLAHYTGAKRRFQERGTLNGGRVIHDYAHHPTEVRATIETATLQPHRHIWCVFQPHNYTRTAKLFDDFATAFTNADTVLLPDIYAPSEHDKSNVNSKMLSDAINANGVNALYIPTLQEIADYLKARVTGGDIVLTLGAGDIDKLDKILCQK